MRPANKEVRSAPAVIFMWPVLLLLLLTTACALTPEAREAKHMAAGKRYLASGKYKEASIEFRVASQNMPKDAESLYQLGMTYLSANAGPAALDSFQKAAGVNPKHEGAQYQVALFEVGSSKPEQVLAGKAVLEKYSAAHPKDAESVGALSLVEAKLGNKEEALRLLYVAVANDPSQLRPASAVIALYAARGDIDTARDIARGIAEKLPDSPDAAVLRAQVSLAVRDVADADAQIDRALELKRDFQPALALRLRRELMTSDKPGAEQTSRTLSRSPQRSMWSAYARMLVAEHKFDEAAAEFDRVLKEHGDPVEIRDEYSATMLADGRRRQAEAIVAATLAKNPKDKTALLQRVTLEIDNGNTEGATKDIDSLLDLKALSGPLSYQQSRLAAARGNSVQQGDLLTDALRRNPRLFSARLDLARLLTGSEKGRTAITVLEGASTIEKSTAEYIFHYNMALMAAGDWERARKGVDAGLAAARSPAFLYQDGLLRARNRDLPGARKSLEASFQAEPSNPLTLSLLNDVMRDQGETPKFLAMLREAVTKNPGSVPLENALGSQLAAQGDRNGARTAYMAARAAGDIAGADVAIAKLDMQTGSFDAAKQRLTDLIKGHDNAPARLLLAEIETRRGSGANAIQHYLKAIEMQPANVAALNNLGDLIASNPSTNGDALFWARKALAIAPSSPIVEDTVGWIYYRQGKYADALPFLERSAQSSDRPLAHYHLAAALIKGGDAMRGRREYELAVKQDPQSAARSTVSPLFDGK